MSTHLLASTDFQPAAGVEDVLNHVQGGNTNLPQFKDGVSVINILESSTAVVNAKDMRVYLTNDSFMGTIAGNTMWIHGVQTNA